MTGTPRRTGTDSDMHFCVPGLAEFTLGPRAVWTRGLARDMSLTYSVAEKPVAFTIFAQRSNC